jgi:hypothetical protein
MSGPKFNLLAPRGESPLRASCRADELPKGASCQRTSWSADKLSVGDLSADKLVLGDLSADELLADKLPLCQNNYMVYKRHRIQE